MPSTDPDRRPARTVRAEAAKQTRLWAMSAICALAGAGMVWRTGEVIPGVSAFLITLAVLGPLLWVYERRKH